MKGNVLVLGNSGCGKSTLINSVLGDEVAKTGWGTKGTTKELQIYENEEVPFRIIDSIGFEPSFLKRIEAIYEVKKWSDKSSKKGNRPINLIWFCVDGTAGKLFDSTIRSLIDATSIYKSVPIIVVITKSYSDYDEQRNINMVQAAFNKDKNAKKRLKKIIPVVALEYQINDSVIVGRKGITELIDATNEAMPQGIHSAKEDLEEFILKRKRFFAQSLISASVASGIAIAAIPTPVADAVILTPLETGMISGLAKIYGIQRNDHTEQLFTTIIEMGTVGALAKLMISGIKSIPGIQLGAIPINMIVAGSIIASLGEGSVYIFEEVYAGRKSPEDLDWIRNVFTNKKTIQTLNAINKNLSSLGSNIKVEDIIKAFLDNKPNK